jgi:hypothetical protein
MNALSDHPNKPRTALCRRGALQKWTGWSNEVIAELVAAGTLKVVRLRKRGRAKTRCYYNVAKVEQLIG